MDSNDLKMVHVDGAFGARSRLGARGRRLSDSRLNRSLLNRNLCGGFTLIELMTVVVIISVLAAIAMSSYKGAVAKSNRGAAKAALVDLAAREEKYLSINNSYATTIAGLYGASSTLTFPIPVPLTGTAMYNITSADITVSNTANPPTFSITATAVGTQVNDQCGNFTLNSVGQETVSGSGSCW